LGGGIESGLPDLGYHAGSNGWTFVGFHGTTSESAANIKKFRILDEFYRSNMGPGGHLGEGSYTTTSASAARQYANDTVDRYDGPDPVRPVVLRIFARGANSMKGLLVPNNTSFADVLDSWITGYDFLTKQMTGFSGDWEIKFNPGAYENLRGPK
jgi:hypothetical protein